MTSGQSTTTTGGDPGRVLITGANGQLGRRLIERLAIGPRGAGKFTFNRIQLYQNLALTPKGHGEAWG